MEALRLEWSKTVWYISEPRLLITLLHSLVSVCGIYWVRWTRKLKRKASGMGKAEHKRIDAFELWC